MSVPKPTPQLEAIFANLVEEVSGLHYGPRDRELFAEKLSTQAQEAGYETLLDYYYRLRYDDPSGAETRALLRALLVHETYFFRELAPLQQLVDGHLAEVIRANGTARVWSAACSTGEEPMTLAMLLDERDLLARVEIIASDLSEHAIESARTGRHGRRALRDGHPAALARRYLTVDDHGVTVAPRIRDAISFRTLNLLDEAGITELGSFDLILCRNVLIYFRDSLIARVVDRLVRSLAPGGVIAVGVSESLLRFGSSLACEERGGAFFYRKVP
jgi:chemotaxis protein methyltransferase CheR